MVAAAIALVLLVAGASLAVFFVRRLRRGLARLAAWGSRPSDDRPP